MVRCFLVLEDGTIVEGIGFGHQKDAFGEVVFNTGMTGYQEALTDPSYTGQILISSYPLIGNYGTTPDFAQSESIHVNGFVVSEWCEHPSRMYKGETVDAFLKSYEVPGISRIDTRDLIINIRDRGTMRGAITYREDVSTVLDDIRGMPLPSESNLVATVSPRSPMHIDRGKELTVGLLDCGSKQGIVRDLASRFNVIRFPYDTGVQEILDAGVDGIMVSNGPGDPSHPSMQNTIANIRELCHQRPMMAICLGNQLVARAFGGATYKMKFGHRGSNQSVKYEDRVFITSQNHGFAVDPDSLVGTGLVPDQFNINDGTVEGMHHEELPLLTVQYHPEASPGPNDTAFLFDRFGDMMRVKG